MFFIGMFDSQASLMLPTVGWIQCHKCALLRASNDSIFQDFLSEIRRGILQWWLTWSGISFQFLKPQLWDVVCYVDRIDISGV
jgi:hypothetical protein